MSDGGWRERPAPCLSRSGQLSSLCLVDAGFGVGFGFLETAALETKNADAVKWYLIHVEPSTNDEQLIELFDAVGSDTIDEQDAVYAVLDRYFNMNMQVQQTGGGMWQRGGFFMTCS